MKEWSDEELDKLFRKSAEELDPPYESSDWNNLRRRLDEADGITPGGGWLKKAGLWLVAGLLLLIGGLGTYYGVSDKVREEKSSVAGTRSTDRPSVQAPHSGRAEAPDFSEMGGTLGSIEENQTKEAFLPGRPTAPPHPGKPPTSPTKKDTQDLKELPQSLASVSGVRKQSNRSHQERGEGAILLPDVNHNQTYKNRKNTTRQESREEGTIDDNVLVPGSSRRVGMEESASGELSAEIKITVQNEMSLRNHWLPLKALTIRSEYLTGHRPDYPVIAYPASSVAPAIPRQETQVPKWSVRIGVSPDVSAVTLSSMMPPVRPGPSVALLVERSIAQRWTLQAGVIRSLKNYNATMDEYEWPETWKQKQMPVSVDGACQVIELPLNVRYDMVQWPKSRWFVGAGISSYKMQNEKYVYNYKYPNDPTINWREKKISTGWALFSHANASVGYEHRLAQRLSMIAEPYLRIPLRGVGFGKVNLFTGGVWFSLRYTPVFRE